MTTRVSHDELLDAVRKVRAGRQYLPKTVQQSLANRMPSSDLSAREAEILGLIVKGLTNKEIAAKLNITVGTVKWHLNILFARLNVADQTQAAVAALHRGIVSSSVR